MTKQQEFLKKVLDSMTITIETIKKFAETLEPNCKTPEEITEKYLKKSSIPILDREFLQAVRDEALGMATSNLNKDWELAYNELAMAADRLDAMHARLFQMIKNYVPKIKIKQGAFTLEEK